MFLPTTRGFHPALILTTAPEAAEFMVYRMPEYKKKWKLPGTSQRIKTGVKCILFERVHYIKWSATDRISGGISQNTFRPRKVGEVSLLYFTVSRGSYSVFPG